MRWIATPILILSFFMMAGGHLMLLQSVAWTQMVVVYTKNSGLTRGLMETFDGRHPCALCEKIENQPIPDQTQEVFLNESVKLLAVISPAFTGVSSDPGRGFTYLRDAWRLPASPGMELVAPVPILAA